MSHGGMLAILSFIRCIQYVLVIVTDICMILLVPNNYTYLQASTLFVYLIVIIYNHREERYASSHTILLINIVISSVFISQLGFENTVFIVLIVSWSVIIILFLLNILYTRCERFMLESRFNRITRRDGVNSIHISIVERSIVERSMPLESVLSEIPQPIQDMTNGRSVQCPICLENITTYVYLTNCNHMYCPACISTWSEQHNTCPVCRELL